MTSPALQVGRTIFFFFFLLLLPARPLNSCTFTKHAGCVQTRHMTAVVSGFRTGQLKLEVTCLCEKTEQNKERVVCEADCPLAKTIVCVCVCVYFRSAAARYTHVCWHCPVAAASHKLCIQRHPRRPAVPFHGCLAKRDHGFSCCAAKRHTHLNTQRWRNLGSHLGGKFKPLAHQDFQYLTKEFSKKREKKNLKVSLKISTESSLRSSLTEVYLFLYKYRMWCLF